MKTYILPAIALSISLFACGNDKEEVVNAPSGCPDAVTSDNTNTMTCGGKTYKTVPIGNQRWMAENLNYNAPGSVCYDRLESYCDIYGRLYDWETAKTACPAGWHLPSDYDWQSMIALVEVVNECNDCAGKYLRAIEGWSMTVSEDKYGFSALPGGYYEPSDGFHGVSYSGDWWSDADISVDVAYSIHIEGGIFDYAHGENKKKKNLYSIRCIKDQ